MLPCGGVRARDAEVRVDDDDVVLAVPRLGAINMHPSLLPRWRGPFPVAWAIRFGEELGSTVHRMDETLDTGPILAQGSVPFEDEWSWQELGPKLEALESELLLQALNRIAAGDEGESQPPTDDPYAGEFEDDYVWVDWSKPVDEVLRQIRAWQFVGLTRNRERGPLAKIRGEQGIDVEEMPPSLEDVFIHLQEEAA